ncbi:MAG: RDD family protein [Cyanobacteria bacterium P01_A01_bin.45]
MSICIKPDCLKPDNSDNTLFCQSCGSELLLEGRYRVIKLLGGGGFGQTYEVTDTFQSNSRVLKVLINNQSKAVELFQREAEVLKSFQSPGIPKVDADGYFIYFPRDTQQPLHCLVMEKIEGLDLYEYLLQRGGRPINQKVAVQWMKEIITILQQVHSQNIFHRDIKPANVMLRANGRIALIDFGTARSVTSTYYAAQSEGKVTGIMSPGYTPLEQMNGQAVPQSDFFALARTFVYVLTGKEPTHSGIYDSYHDEVRWRHHIKDISPKFADLIDRMMARSPSQRPQNTGEILQVLYEIENTISPSTPIPDLASSVPETEVPYYRKSNQTQNSYQAPPKYPQQQPTPQYQQPTQPSPQIQYNQQYPNVAKESSISNNDIKYANFWKRFAAALIDGIILYIVSYIIGFILGVLYVSLLDTRAGLQGIAFILGIVINWLYYANMESSEKQATLGKQALGICVTDTHGERISFGQATARHFGKFISSIILFIGYIMAAFTEKKQALHDMIAGTLVIDKK